MQIVKVCNNTNVSCTPKKSNPTFCFRTTEFECFCLKKLPVDVRANYDNALISLGSDLFAKGKEASRKRDTILLRAILEGAQKVHGACARKIRRAHRNLRVQIRQMHRAEIAA